MPLITPALFGAGAAAATGPIIIHLLNRRRFKILDWAAMEFLLQSQRKNRRRVKLEELLLLLLRVLAILLMGLALARPLLSAVGSAIPILESGKDVVIILDDSYSMAQKHGAETVFAKAQDGLLQLAGRVSKKDNFAVFLTSKQDPFFAPGYLTEMDVFKNDVKDLKHSDYATDLVGTVQRAMKVFEESKNPDKRLYLLSDFREREWNLDATESQAKKIAAMLATLDRNHFEATMVDFGLEDSSNLGVSELVCTSKHIVKNVRLQFRVTVINNGPQAAESVPVSLQINEIKLPGRILDRIEPGQTKSVEFSYRFKEAGPAAVTASIQGDQLAADNAAYLAFNVVDAVPILLVNGNPDLQPFVNEVDYFIAALDPGRKNLSGFRPETVLDRDLPNVKLANYDCVVLANVGSMLPDHVKQVEEYVRTGGGLIVFLGDKVDRTFYNERLFNEGRGLLPLAFDPPRGEIEKKQKAVKLKKSAVNHPILAVFSGSGEQLLDLVPFYQYFPLRTDRGASAVTVLASAVDPEVQNPPMIVEKTFGKGRVIQVASSMNARWNDWPKSISYPIVVNEMVNHLSRMPRYENTQLVGGPLKREIEPEFFEAEIMLKTPRFPDEPPVKVAPKLVGQQMFVTWPQPIEASETEQRGRPVRVDKKVPGLDQAGIYTLELGATLKTRKDYFARNVEPDEGRLKKADNTVARQVMKDINTRFWQGIPGTVTAEAGGGRELWRIVLLAVLGILVVETILAQRFGHYTS